MTRLPLQPLWAISLLALACAHARIGPVVSDRPETHPPKEDRVIRFLPILVHVTPADVALSELNDEELFAIGQNAMAAGDNQKALTHFEYLIETHPDSKHRSASLNFAGLMHERMKDYTKALDRFTEAAKAYGPTQEGAEAQFKMADEYFFLGDYDAASAQLEPLASATYLSGAKQMEARSKRGVVLFNAGRLDEAEKIFRTAIDEMKEGMKDDYRDGYLPSQAQFYLAEILRSRFLDQKIDTVKGTKDEISEHLNAKAQTLLSAQAHYILCIRIGHPEWATASGYRIGELYQSFYEDLMNAAPPKELDADAVPFYRDELHKQLRNVVRKAIDAYEKTLDAAERVGATNPFIQQTRDQLDKMKTLMLNEKATATESPTPPAQKKPGES
jgi:tetratricopeptide (TPR) repeat protein